MNFSEAKKFLLILFNRAQDNEVTARGAQLSYFLILSIFPFLIFLLTLLDYTPLTQQQTLQQLSYLLPNTAFIVVEQILTEIASADQLTLLSFGFLAAIWAASRGTFAIIKSINKAYKTKETRSIIFLNFIGIASIFALASIILLTLALLVFGKIIGEIAFQNLGIEEFFYPLWVYLRHLIPVLLTFITFCLLYLFAPSLPLHLRTVYPGAIFSTLGWIAASQAFAYYVNNFSNFSRTYGSIGGIIVFLVWLYISSAVILFGGEINAALYHNYIDKTGSPPGAILPLKKIHV
jgi:membrane protein